LAQGAQVDRVQLLVPLASLGRLQDHGQPLEPGVVDEVTERLEAEATPADGRVPVDPAPALAQAVVHVPDADAADAHRPDSSTQGRIVLLPGPQGIAGRENVAGVRADAEPLGLGDEVEDAGEVLEATV